MCCRMFIRIPCTGSRARRDFLEKYRLEHQSPGFLACASKKSENCRVIISLSASQRSPERHIGPSKAESSLDHDFCAVPVVVLFVLSHLQLALSALPFASPCLTSVPNTAYCPTSTLCPRIYCGSNASVDFTVETQLESRVQLEP